MVKTAGNTLEWVEHPLTVAGKGGYAIREGNTYNLLGGELPVGQAFAIFLNLAQTPATLTDSTFGYTRRVYDYSIAPLNRILNHEKFTRVTGSGLQDLTLGGTYVGTTQKIYRVKVLEDSTDPETIAYRVSTDGGTTFGDWTAPSGGANMSTSFSAIADGITIKFKAVTGHTETDEWEFYTGMPPSVEEAKQTTGSGLNDLTLTVQSAQDVVVTHRGIFTIKIMTAATPDTYQYSIDGGVTYNGSNINCATSAIELGSTNVMIEFGATTGHTVGNIWKFHVFPTTTFARYAPRGDRLLVGWVENMGETKTKQVLMSAAALGESKNIIVPDSVTIDAEGITYGGDADFTSDGSTLTTAANFLRFAGADNISLGGFSGKKIAVGTQGVVPSPTGAIGDNNDDIAQYLYTVGSGINYQILDLNRGMINDLHSLSQSSHEQTDGQASIGWLTAGINDAVTSIAVNDGTLFNTTNRSRISIDKEEMLITNVSSNVLTVTRGYNNTTAATHDAGSSGNRNINYSWDNAGTTSGARQHVRMPPNNAKTARSTQASGHQTYEPGWALSTDIEANNLGPVTLVLERSQGASTGQPNRPWNTEWRQIGGAIGGIAVSGQTTIDGVHASGASDYSDVTFVGTGITLTTDNNAKTVTFKGRNEVDIMTDGFIFG